MTKRVQGKTIKWEWTKGEYSGAIYQNTFHEDGKVTWKGIAGAEAGDSATEDKYSVEQVTDSVFMVSWLENIGDTVTITLNFENHTIFGVISNNKEWTVVSGKILEVN
ncbi:hypothetical protein IGJ68_002140 [Enterococcus sp. DIV0564]|uniref:phenolic acid decarboxylase n=1 Tax=Enterococcus TaxID=1350 RepID=UPI001A9622E3|nr:phenolic acid decarboxylase [Enterococcus faecalis]